MDKISEIERRLAEIERRLNINPSQPYMPMVPEFGTQFMPVCGCRVGTVCGSAACPHRIIVTSAQGGGPHP